jgi:homoprotocatechuate degradation regulator HpaR
VSSRASKLRRRNLPLLLLQARERVISHFRPLLNAHGITEQQWRIVRVLLETPALEPRQIGELCGISSPSLAGVLERMEQGGLVARRRVASDQRRVRVSLTGQARELAAAMAPQVDATYRRLEKVLGADFMRSVQDSLDHLLASLEPGHEQPVAKARTLS